MPAKKQDATSAKARNKDRGEDKTTMTISLPKELKKAIEAEAKKQNRPISNYVVTEMLKLLGSSSLVAVVACHALRCGSDWSAHACLGTLRAVGMWIGLHS